MDNGSVPIRMWGFPKGRPSRGKPRPYESPVREAVLALDRCYSSGCHSKGGKYGCEAGSPESL